MTKTKVYDLAELKEHAKCPGCGSRAFRFDGTQTFVMDQDNPLAKQPQVDTGYLTAREDSFMHCCNSVSDCDFDGDTVADFMSTFPAELASAI